MEICEFCLKEFRPPNRSLQAPRRFNWFCSDSHRSAFNQGFLMCQCCKKKRMKKNDIVCKKCHKELKARLI